MLQNNYKYAWVLQLAKEEAKSNKVGIWSNGIIPDNKVNENATNTEYYEINNSIIVIIVIIILAMIIVIVEKRNKNKVNK